MRLPSSTNHAVRSPEAHASVPLSNFGRSVQLSTRSAKRQLLFPGRRRRVRGLPQRSAMAVRQVFALWLAAISQLLPAAGYTQSFAPTTDTCRFGGIQWLTRAPVLSRRAAPSRLRYRASPPGALEFSA